MASPSGASLGSASCQRTPRHTDCRCCALNHRSSDCAVWIGDMTSSFTDKFGPDSFAHESSCISHLSLSLFTCFPDLFLVNVSEEQWQNFVQTGLMYCMYLEVKPRWATKMQTTYERHIQQGTIRASRPVRVKHCLLTFMSSVKICQDGSVWSHILQWCVCPKSKMQQSVFLFA